MSASMIACFSAAYAWSRKLTLELSGCSPSVGSAGRVPGASATVVMASSPISAFADARQPRAGVANQALSSMQCYRRALRSLANERQHDVGSRSRNAGEETQLLHHTDQRLDLHRPAALQVLQHRHLVRPQCACAVDASLDIDTEVQTEAVADRFRFEHHRSTDRARSRIAADDIDRRQGQRAYRVEAHVAA